MEGGGGGGLVGCIFCLQNDGPITGGGGAYKWRWEG